MKIKKAFRNHRAAVGLLAVVTVAAISLFFSSAAAAQGGEEKSTPSKQHALGKSTGPQPGQETFPTAMDASKALVKAVKGNDQPALLKILGPNSKEIISSGDDAEDRNDREQFVKKYRQMHRMVIEPDGTTTLYIGAENWPTPIPLVKKGDSWYFETAAGKEEILYRRIGKNELSAIQVCRELVDAQKEYYGQTHDGESSPQYAQKIFSDPGKHNGLYWEASSGEKQSPIGPLLASAADEGNNEAANQKLQPFEGYYFRTLTAAKESSGSRSYIADGKMTRGFAFVAYPAEYRSSGVMTFVVNQDGIVYEKDLGPRTAKIAKTLTRYDRDASWRKAD